jgi:hypothetical protein
MLIEFFDVAIMLMACASFAEMGYSLAGRRYFPSIFTELPQA